MSGLPARFPRASLIQHAAMLESRIQKHLDDTRALVDEYDARGLELQVRKLQDRYRALHAAREAINDARLALWNLP